MKTWRILNDRDVGLLRDVPARTAAGAVWKFRRSSSCASKANHPRVRAQVQTSANAADGGTA